MVFAVIVICLVVFICCVGLFIRLVDPDAEVSLSYVAYLSLLCFMGYASLVGFITGLVYSCVR